MGSPPVILRFADCRLDPRRRELRRAGEEVVLARLPFDLLLFFVRHPDEVHSKDRLVREVWEEDFVSDASVARAVSQVRRAVGDDASEPRVLRTHYGRGYQFVAPVEVEEAEDAAAGPAGAEAFLPEAAADPARADAGPAAPGDPASRSRARRRLGLGAALALAILGGTLVLASRSEAPPAPGRTAPSVAVLGFSPVGPESGHEWVETALGEWLTSELAVGSGLRTVPREEVERLLRDLELEPRPGLSPERLAAVGDHCGSRWVLAGTWAVLEGELRFDVRVQDTIDGTVRASVRRRGPLEDLFALVEDAGREVRAGLGVDPVPALGAGRPRDLHVARLHAEALVHLRRGDAPAARDLLLQAVAREPGFAHGWADLARAWSELGYGLEAGRAADRAIAAAVDLPTDLRRPLEARALSASGQWARAAKAWWVLHESEPEDPEIALALAESLAASGQPEAALRLVRALRSRPAPVGTDPRIDLAEARAAEAASDFLLQRRAARAALEAAELRGARSLAARARLVEAGALRHLGEPDAARRLVDEAEELFAGAGDRGAVAEAGMQRAILAHDGGDVDVALAGYRGAAQMAARIGDRDLEARAIAGEGVVLWQQGRLPEARARFETAAETLREIGDAKRHAEALNRLGAVLVREGRLEEAAGRFASARDLHRSVGDRGGEAAARSNLAALAAVAGRVEEAARELEAAAAAFREIGNRQGEAATTVNLGIQMRAVGRLEASETAFRRGLDLAEQIGRPGLAAGARFGLGEVARIRGRWSEAEAFHREALETRREIGEDLPAIHARIAVARVLRLSGRPAESLAELDGVVADLAPLDAPDVDGEAAAVRAEVAMDLGRTEEADRALDRALARSADSGDGELLLEIGLAQVRRELERGDRGAAQRRVEDLLERARAAELAVRELEIRWRGASAGLTDEDPAVVRREIEERGWLGLPAPSVPTEPPS